MSGRQPGTGAVATDGVSLPIDRIAWDLARFLNDPESWAIWRQRFQAAEQRRGGAPGTVGTVPARAGDVAYFLMERLTRRADTVLSHEYFSDRMDADEAAHLYLQRVLEKPMILVRREPVSATHRLLLALVRRTPEPGWDSAELARDPEGSETARTGIVAFGAARHLGEALARLPRTNSKHSAAATIRTSLGPLVLRAARLAVELPDELSVMGTFQAGPERLALPEDKMAERAFTWEVIRALRSAHRLYQELCGLAEGLCPLDWLDGTLSIGQVQAVRRLKATVEARSDAQGNAFADIATVAKAWETAPVPGFRDVTAFLESPLGQALRGLRMRRVSPAPTEENAPDWIETAPDGEDADGADGYLGPAARILDRRELEQILQLLRDAGKVTEDDIALVLGLFDGTHAGLEDLDTRIRAVHRKIKRLRPMENDDE